MHEEFACRAQAALGWLVLNANQLESSSSHPGSIAIAGDFNKHFVYPPPPAAISTLHRLQTTLKVQAKRTLDTQPSRASTVAHVKMTLANLCNQLQANKAVIFEGVFLNPLVLMSIHVLHWLFPFGQEVHCALSVAYCSQIAGMNVSVRGQPIPLC